ncbi:MAG: class I SAM-dependent methyltransferase [Dehalococcoidia bacterium]|nr:class I SAM-dependent methyltransferase [Dehalococcoidia bacterium]
MDEASRLRDVYARRAAEGRDGVGRYSPFDVANLYLIQRLEADVLALLRAEGVTSFADLQVLDVGCGTGTWLRRFALHGAAQQRLAGIDLRGDAIEQARALGLGMDLRVGNAAAMPWEDGSFDLVCQFTAFSSVLDAATREGMAAEMRRVLTPGGLILWYDMVMNPTNRNVIGLGRGDVRALFPGATIRFRRVTLAPPLGRRVAPRSWIAARTLEALPLLRTHLLAAVRPQART